MQALFKALGVSEETLVVARAAMARQMRHEGEALIDEAVCRTMQLPGYRNLDVALVRPNTARSMAVVLDALERGDDTVFGEFLAVLAYRRAREGLPTRSFYLLTDITESLLLELAMRCLDDPRALLAASIVARRITDSSRTAVMDGFQLAYMDARTEVELLASQFSAPVLPALPGVLVLPIVGAVSQARAEQIIDAILDAVEHHAAHTVILDVTGIVDVTVTLADHVRSAIASARLLGAELVLVGVSAKVARLLSTSAPSLDEVRAYPTLAMALVAAAAR